MSKEHGFTKVWMRVGLTLHFTDAELEQIKNDTDGTVLNKILIEHIQGGQAVIGGDVHIPELDIDGNVSNISITQTGYEPTHQIHLIPVVGNANGRKFCENYENHALKSVKEFDEICTQEGIQGATTYSLNEFMDLFNNADGDVEELDPQKYWLTYTR